MNKDSILILGKLPPPYLGPAIATKTILESDLKNRYRLIHISTKLNLEYKTIGRRKISKIFKSFSIYARFIKALIEYKPKIVLLPIAQETVAFYKDFLFILLGWLFQSKVIIHLRGSNWQNWLSNTSIFTRKVVTIGMKMSTCAIVLGDNLKYLFRQYFNEEKIFVVPNGGNYYFPKIEKPSHDPIILFFSNLLESKGILDVIEATLILKLKHIKFNLNCVGAFYDEIVEEKIKTMIRENNLPVKIFSQCDGDLKQSFFSMADIFVFTPIMPEGHPWVIVEAMAAGLPIVTTNQGAICESVYNGVNGYIVEPKSPNEIAQKLMLLIEDIYMRNSFGNSSFKIYKDKFTEDRMVAKLDAVFQTVINLP